MLTQWLFFTNARSNRLADLVQNNKAVILFTPRNMHLRYIPTYLLVSIITTRNYFDSVAPKKSKSFLAV